MGDADEGAGSGDIKARLYFDSHTVRLKPDTTHGSELTALRECEDNEGIRALRVIVVERAAAGGHHRDVLLAVSSRIRDGHGVRAHLEPGDPQLPAGS